MNCPVCETRVAGWMKACPRCGDPLTQPTVAQPQSTRPNRNARVAAAEPPSSSTPRPAADTAAESRRSAAFGGPTGDWPQVQAPITARSTGRRSLDQVSGRQVPQPHPRRRVLIVTAGAAVIIAAGSITWFAVHGQHSVAAGNNAQPMTPTYAPGAAAVTDGASDSPSPVDSVSSPVASASTSGDDAEYSELSNVQAILDDSVNSRTRLHDALQNACSDSDGSLQTINNVMDQRQTEIANAQELNLTDVPDGAELDEDLVTLLQASTAADSAYLTYVQDVNSDGCSAGKSAFDHGNALSQIAQAAKIAFFAVWSPLASQYSFPEHSKDDV